ncbi:MAG: hypothetical protein WBK20_15595 [Spirochaetota bacterium]
MTIQHDIPINISIPHDEINIFIPILQKGFCIKTYSGSSIMEFLLQCGLSEEYIVNNIKTVFLDNKPVDDLINSFIEDDSTLSLSGAMPGLVGAVMRIRSPFQSFRNTISYATTPNKGTTTIRKEAIITLKLFNTVLSDTAILFLRNGIFIDGKTLLSLIKNNKNIYKKWFIQYNDNLLHNSEAITLMEQHHNDLIFVKLVVVN